MKALANIGRFVSRKSPEILLVSAVVGTVAGVVTAIVATTKAPKVLVEHSEALSDVHAHGLPEKTEKKALAKVYLTTGSKLAALYAPTMVLTATSIACMVISNKKQKERIAALGAAYTALDTAFKSYRDGVIKRFGEKIDEEIRLGMHEEEVTETVIEEDGKKRKVKNTVLVAEEDCKNPYRKVFDESNPNWVGKVSDNLVFIREVERWANFELKNKKKLFLNDVFDNLGFPKTQAGQVVGWRYLPDNNENGDNFVSFKIFDCFDRSCRDASDFKKNVVVLEFNVDGPIIDCLPEK